MVLSVATMDKKRSSQEIMRRIWERLCSLSAHSRTVQHRQVQGYSKEEASTRIPETSNRVCHTCILLVMTGMAIAPHGGAAGTELQGVLQRF